jgi:hypothetical protein
VREAEGRRSKKQRKKKREKRKRTIEIVEDELIQIGNEKGREDLVERVC